jgi:hypothetical protein
MRVWLHLFFDQIGTITSLCLETKLLQLILHSPYSDSIFTIHHKISDTKLQSTPLTSPPPISHSPTEKPDDADDVTKWWSIIPFPPSLNGFAFGGGTFGEGGSLRRLGFGTRGVDSLMTFIIPI